MKLEERSWQECWDLLKKGNREALGIAALITTMSGLGFYIYLYMHVWYPPASF